MTTLEKLDEVEAKVVDAVAVITSGTARLTPLLAVLHRMKSWETRGHTSLAHWLAWRTGMSLGPAREHVRVALALEDLPVAAAALASGDISYSKARALTRTATPENEAALVEVAKMTTATDLERIVRSQRPPDDAETTRDRAQIIEESRMLEISWAPNGMLDVHARLAPEEGALVRRALDDAMERVGYDRPSALVDLADRALNGGGERTGADRTMVIVHVQADALSDPRFEGESRLADGPGVPAETSRRLACDASIAHFVDGEQVGRRSRTWGRTLRRELDLRDHASCRFPGCTHRRTDAHHLVHWIDGGRTTLANGILVCRRHHTLVHEGGWHVERTPDGKTLFRSPDGQILRPVPHADVPAETPH